MTDVRGRGSGFGADAERCPDFEALSRFADEEVGPEEGVSLQEHVNACEPCERLVDSLRIGFPAPGVPRERSTTAPGCAEAELLLAHLTATLPAEAEQAVKSHLAACDACVDLLSLFHRRLNVAGVIEAPVPAAVRARAWSALAPELAKPAPPAPAAAGSWGRRVEQRVSRWLRLPVLVPLSVSAGALLMVTMQETGLLSSAPRPMTRAVDHETRLRVTAPAANVRAEPHRQSEVLTVVSRGTVVEVAGEERDWYRVKLSDERLGWVERDAFE